MSVLVFNAGSSTLKFALFGGRPAEPTAEGIVEGPPAGPAGFPGRDGPARMKVRRGGGDGERTAPVDAGMNGAVEAILGAIRDDLAADPPAAVGHRVVHGGRSFSRSVVLDAAARDEIERLAELAPLHNPPAVAAIDAARRAIPGVPHVAVFDTAFFAELPPARRVYPLPYEWYEKRGVRRFGFHGISHEYCAARAAELLGGPAETRRVVTCHLGNGCSATAARGGKAVATTMGFTPLEGLVMGTRAGSIDPGILLYAMDRMGLSPAELDDVLQRRSGLFGVSGVSSDFRTVQEAASGGNERAKLAITIYANAIRAAVGALWVALGGADALVFTAGVGENSAPLREEACEGLDCLGLRLDPERNRSLRPDADVAAAGSPARILIVRTREELQIAREAFRLSSGDGGPDPATPAPSRR